MAQELRRFQSSAMEMTVIAPHSNKGARAVAGSSASMNTSGLQGPDSPVWSSGSAAIKKIRIRLHDAKTKVWALESEVENRKRHEEFYIYKARERKNRALKYERKLWASNKVRRVVTSTVAAEALSLQIALSHTVYLCAVLAETLRVDELAISRFLPQEDKNKKDGEDKRRVV